MYVGSFPPVSTRADLTLTFSVEDDDTGDAVDLTGALIVIEARYPRSSSIAFTATTSNGKVTITDTGEFRLDIAAAEMSALPSGTYDIGCTIARDGETRQLVIGTLPVLDGVVTQ